MKHCRLVEFLSIFGMSSPPEQTQSPPFENLLATVLGSTAMLRTTQIITLFRFARLVSVI